MDKEIECTFSKFADDTKLTGVDDKPEGLDPFREMNKVEMCAHGILMRFNKTRCWCCSWIGASPSTSTGWG